MCLVHKHRQGTRIAVIHRELALVRPVDNAGISSHRPKHLLAELWRQLSFAQSVRDESSGVRVEAMLTDCVWYPSFAISKVGNSSG